MITTQQNNRGEEDGPIPRDTLNALIGRNVVHSLGSPGDLFKMQVRPIGGDRYRVNVFVGRDVTSARIADSFFLTADGEGNIVNSSPEIVRVYRTGRLVRSVRAGRAIPRRPSTFGAFDPTNPISGSPGKDFQLAGSDPLTSPPALDVARFAREYRLGLPRRNSDRGPDLPDCGERVALRASDEQGMTRTVRTSSLRADNLVGVAR